MWETRHSIADRVCFEDSHFAGDFEDSKSSSGGVLCNFGSRTFVPVRWMCKEQTFVSHSSTESEIISLDAGYGWVTCSRSWDMVIEVVRSTNISVQPKHTSHQETGALFDSKTKTQHVKRRQKVEQLSDVDHVPTNTHSSHNESQLYIFEDNEAVIKVIIKGRSPTMRHVSRTHRVQNPNQYVNTKNQLADILTKGSFSRDDGNTFLFFNIINVLCILVAKSVIFLLMIRLESRAPCQNEVKMRLRMKADGESETMSGAARAKE